MGKLQQMTAYIYEQDSNEACHRCSQLQQKCHKFATPFPTTPCWECIAQGDHNMCSFKDNIYTRLLPTFKETSIDLSTAMSLNNLARQCLHAAQSPPNPETALKISQQSNDIPMLIKEAIAEDIYRDSMTACDLCSAHSKPCSARYKQFNGSPPSSGIPCGNCQMEGKACIFSKRRKPACFPCILRKTPCRGKIPCTACPEHGSSDRCEDQTIFFGHRLEHVDNSHGDAEIDSEHISHMGDYHTILSYVQRLNITVFDFFNHIKCDFIMNECIGSGAVMNVFEGLLTRDGGGEEIKVALKIPGKLITKTTNISQINSILAAVRQELRMMKHLDKHPSIVSLFGVAFRDLNPVLVVEYAPTNLTNHLVSRKAEHRPVDWRTKMRLCCEIADGLQAVHKVNIVHGDLKADNILLFVHPSDKDKLVAKISDFGFSATNASIAEGRSTGGTPRFNAPECIESASRKLRKWANKPQKDNYAYGLLAWQTAQNGDEPFKGRDIEQINNLKKMYKESLDLLIEELDGEVPDGFKELIRAMTAYHPKNRAPLERVRKIMGYDDDDNDSGYVEPSIDGPTEELPRDEGLPEIGPAQLMSIPSPIKAELFRAYKEEALKEDKTAAYFLSVCYGSGFGVKVNKEQMVTWAIKAAEYGSLQAVENIASQFSFWELPDNRKELFEYLKRAADGGHRDSMKWVAFCYCYGGGAVERDENKWEEWKKKFEDTSHVSESGPSGPSLKLALHFAAGTGNIEAVKFIIKQTKTNANARDEFKRAPLHIAAEHGHVDMVNILSRKYDAEINARDGSGWTPLHTAAANNRFEVVSALLELSADVNVRDDFGWTPMHEAASRGHVEVINLLKQKANVNAISHQHETPLLMAVEKNHIETVKLLIKSGADISIKDDYDRTPHSLADANTELMNAFQTCQILDNT